MDRCAIQKRRGADYQWAPSGWTARERIVELEANGHSAAHAKYFLAGLELLQAARRDSRDWLLKQLDNMKWMSLPFSHAFCLSWRSIWPARYHGFCIFPERPPREAPSYSGSDRWKLVERFRAVPRGLNFGGGSPRHFLEQVPLTRFRCRST